MCPLVTGVQTCALPILIGRPGELFACTLSQPRSSGGGAALDGAIISPMPGRLISVAVAEGEWVTKGQKIVTLEAMNRENRLRSEERRGGTECVSKCKYSRSTVP